ncbi:hypothetical protein KEM55_000794 [Ascosphaera atra]|nr:hypothetical protein KEM55_000794 [Ascosphaera atra]
MAFIFLIWIFVAVTGVACSIGPLLVGRWAISMLVPREVEVNDIYAFSTGVYILGSILYVGYHCSTFFRRWRESRHPKSLLVRIWNAFKKLAGFVYLIIAFTAVLPSLFALCMEFYVLTPLHTTIAPGQEHVIYSVQDWALGVLYLRMAIRFIQWRSRSRPALALKAIIRNGWLSPDVRLATRAFILPVAMFASLAIAIPIPLGLLINATFLRSYPVSLKEETVRYTYPFTLCCALAIWVIVFVSRQIKALRIDLRDDVYLIGEQLHNFGERPVQDMGASRPMMAS